MYPFPNTRKLLSKHNQLLVLTLFPCRTVSGMITVLLAVSRVPTRSLQMALGVRTDPYVLPGGRYHQRLNPAKNRRVPNQFSLRIVIPEAFPGTNSRDAGSLGGHIR